MKYLTGLNKNIFVEFFPPYSPEPDPTETCWKTIRATVTNSTYFPTLESMREEIESFIKNKRFTLNLPPLLMSLTKKQKGLYSTSVLHVYYEYDCNSGKVA